MMDQQMEGKMSTGLIWGLLRLMLKTLHDGSFLNPIILQGYEGYLRSRRILSIQEHAPR